MLRIVALSFVALFGLCQATNYTGWTLNECARRPTDADCEVWGRNSQSHLFSVACPPNRRPHNCTVVVQDVLLTAAKEAAALSLRRQWQAGDSLEDFFGAFRNPTEYASFATELATTFAPYVKLESIGTSHEGRSIQVIHITTGDSANKRAIVYGGLIHAREWLAGMSGMFTTFQILNRLKNGDRQITDLLAVADVYAIPIQNPDGFAYTWTSSANRYWRKTRRPNPGSSCIGTDPNRNFPPRWDGNDGSSGNPCSETFRGSSPLSEKETQGLSNLLATLGDKTVVWYDIHAYGAMFMSAWGKTNQLPPDYSPTMINYLQAAQSAMRSVAGRTFSVGSISNTIYIATGSSVDYGYDTFGILGSITIEVRGSDFVTPPSEIGPSGAETYEGLMAVIRQLL